MIKGYFQRFSNHAFHLLTYSVRSDSPQLFFPGSRELEVTSPTLRRSHSSPAILCRLIWYCIISRHRSSIVCINMISCFIYLEVYIRMVCILCMNWVWNWDLCDLWYHEYGLILRKFILLEMMFIWKVFYTVLNS